MYELTGTYVQSELDYRAERIRSSAVRARRRPHVRVPRVRRPAEASDNAG